MSVTLKVKGTHSYLAQIDRGVLDSLNLANDEGVVLRFGDRRLTLEYVTHLNDDNARGVIALHPDHRNELGLEIGDEVQIEKVKITEAEMLLARPMHERVPGITQKASRFFRRELSRGLLSRGQEILIALARDSFQLKIVGFFPNVSTAKFGGHTYLYVSDEPPKIEYYVTELVRKEMPQILLRLNLALLNASEYGEFEVTIYNGQNLTLLIQDYKKIGNEIIDKFNRDIASSWENNIFLNVDLARVKHRILEAWFQK